jgi:hypothetical protein
MVMPKKEISSEFELQKTLELFKTNTCKHCNGSGKCSCKVCAVKVKCPICGLSTDVQPEDRSKEFIECLTFKKLGMDDEQKTHAFSPADIADLGTCGWCSGKGKVYNSVHQSLLEGMDIVARRIKMQEMTNSDASVDDMYCWVDDLIKEKMGGKRMGMKIYWTLPQGEFVYDPITEKLVGPKS